MDPAAGLARPAEPLPHLPDLFLPLRHDRLLRRRTQPGPGHLHGHVGPAPGGNTGLPGLLAGTTAYFPVSVEGALFFIGDGHAVQGDGEIVGTGIETSFEVEFTLHVLKGKQINWQHSETAISSSLPAIRGRWTRPCGIATTEMLRWLTGDYGLAVTEASMLLGQCVEYDLGNIFDPAYTMVCRSRSAGCRTSHRGLGAARGRPPGAARYSSNAAGVVGPRRAISAEASDPGRRARNWSGRCCPAERAGAPPSWPRQAQRYLHLSQRVLDGGRPQTQRHIQSQEPHAQVEAGETQQLGRPPQANGIGEVVGQHKIEARLEIGGRRDRGIGRATVSRSISGGCIWYRSTSRTIR